MSAFVLPFAMMLVLAACGSDGGGTAEPKSSAQKSGAADTPQVVDGKLVALADGFPDAPITLWSAFSPGHTTDVLNRAVADIASEFTPVRVTTDTHEAGPGVNFTLVRDFLSTQPRYDDGYHLDSGNWTAFALHPYQNEALPDAEVEDLCPVASVYTAPFAFGVTKDNDFQSLEEVVDFARANPGELRYVSGVANSSNQLEMGLWLEDIDVEMVHVPTSGGDESVQVMLGGGAQLMGTGLNNFNLEQFRILAVEGTERVDVVPDASTMNELGYTGPQYARNAFASLGFGVSCDAPKSHVEWLEQMLRMVTEDQRFLEAYDFAKVELVPAEDVRAGQQATLEVMLPVLDKLGLNLKKK